MRRGAAISGGLHAVLLALAIWGADWFRSREAVPLNVTEIDMIDGSELDARLSTAPVIQNDGPSELAPPSQGDSALNPERPPDPAAEPAAAAMLAMASPPQPRPDTPPVDIPPPPMEIPSEAPVPTIAEVPSPDPLAEQSVVPESPPSTEPVQPLASVLPPGPAARPLSPAAEPEPDPAPDPEEATVPQPTAAEPDEATVPQPTAPEPPKPDPEPADTADPVQLAAAQPDAPQSLAPREARLPVARPAERARAAPASSRPEPAPEQVAAEEPKEEDEPVRQAEAEPTPAQPAGGSSRPTAPLSNGEKDALRLGIKKYYVYGGRSDPSLRVTVRIRMDEQARIVGKPEMVSAEGGDPASQKALYDAGRRALIQAQNGGEFAKLPPDKYAAWSVLNVVFTTEKGIDFST